MKKFKLGQLMEANSKLESAVHWYNCVNRMNPETKAAQKEVELARDNFNTVKTGLEEILADVQKRCRERTITAIDICRELSRIDSELNLSKRAKKGITVRIDCNAQDFPRAYKYTPESTIFEAVFDGKEWCLTDIRRDRCTNRKGYMVLTDEAKQALINRFESLVF